MMAYAGLLLAYYQQLRPFNLEQLLDAYYFHTTVAIYSTIDWQVPSAWDNEETYLVLLKASPFTIVMVAINEVIGALDVVRNFPTINQHYLVI